MSKQVLFLSSYSLQSGQNVNNITSKSMFIVLFQLSLNKQHVVFEILVGHLCGAYLIWKLFL